MRTFEVDLNGKKLCLAGIGNDGVLTAIVDWVVGPRRADMGLTVGGLILPVQEHVKWLDRKLRVGDEIKIKIGERISADIPKTRQRRDPVEELKVQKQYVRRMAKQFGWRIQVRQPI